MECLVDDTMNSNILSKCIDCGLDSPSASVSGDMYVRCENCMDTANRTVVNNNSQLQTHRDFVPSPDLTRPRCCSCLETSSPVRSPNEYPELDICLDVPQTRPRSSSCSNQPVSRDQSERNASRSLCQNRVATSTETTQNSPVGLLIGNIAESLEHCSLTVHSLHHSYVSPDKLDSELPSDTVMTSERCVTSSLQTCPRCGLLSVTNDTNLAETDLLAPSSNVNIQQNPLEVGISSQASLNICASLPAVSTNASSVSIVVDVCNTTASSWSNTASESIPQPDDCVLPKTHSPFKQCQEITSESTNHTTDPEPHHSGTHLRPTYLTSVQIISHNAELNRIKTATGKRTTTSTRSSRITHGHFRIGIPARSARHSLSSSTVLPMVITPDSPLPCLPSEFLYKLHDLDHEKEDISAEVVYSLHFRDYQIKELLGK